MNSLYLNDTQQYEDKPTTPPGGFNYDFKILEINGTVGGSYYSPKTYKYQILNEINMYLILLTKTMMTSIVQCIN